MRRTASDRILALSATIKMPPFRWYEMRFHCHTCAARTGDGDGHRWPSLSRVELREQGAQQLRCAGGGVILAVPLTLLWWPSPDDSDIKTPPHCFLHEIRAEWNHALRSAEAFGVQDLTRFRALEPLDHVSYSADEARGR